MPLTSVTTYTIGRHSDCPTCKSDNARRVVYITANNSGTAGNKIAINGKRYGDVNIMVTKNSISEQAALITNRLLSLLIYTL